MTIMSKLASAIGRVLLPPCMADERHAAPDDPEPLIQPVSRPLRKAGSAAPSGWSGVTARAQILVEQQVVSVNVTFVLRRQLLAGARGLDLGLGALAVESVELGANRAAGLPRRQGGCAWIAKVVVALCAPGERGDDDRRGRS